MADFKSSSDWLQTLHISFSFSDFKKKKKKKKKDFKKASSAPSMIKHHNGHYNATYSMCCLPNHDVCLHGTGQGGAVAGMSPNPISSNGQSGPMSHGTKREIAAITTKIGKIP